MPSVNPSARGNNVTGKLRFNDVVSFSYLSNNWTKVKDDYEGAFRPSAPGQPHSGAVGNIPEGASGTDPQAQQIANSGLNVQIAATHSGVVIRNNRFYLPERMKKGAPTFTKDFFKPVLLHHDQDKDPVGRIIDAAYVDTSGIVQDKYRGLEVKNSTGKTIGTINDALIQDFTTDKMPFGQQVDVIRNVFRDSLLEDDEYTGLGYIKILANIANPDSIQKLLDGRYITGSVGASTNRAVCSICKSDWAKEGPCEHKPGAIYDEAKCFLIAGDLSYEEYSFVNVPADRHSKVLQLDYNGNTTDIDVADDYQGRIYEVQLEFPQYDSATKEEMGMANKDANTNDNLNIQDNVNADPAPDAEPQNTEGAQDIADSANNEGASDEANSNNTDIVQDTKGEEEDTGNEIKDFVAMVVETEDALSVKDEEAFYEEIWSEVLAAFKDGEFTIDQLSVEKIEDAKLSTEKRKKLPKSSFCGPNKSFPVPDCAHVTAARRLIGRYKGEGDKSTILACVSRKAKAMGCESKSKDSVQDSVETQDGSQHARIMQIILAAFEENRWSPDDEKPLTDDDKKTLTDILKRIATMVSKDSFQEALYAENLAHNESALLDEVISLEEKVGDLRDRLEASQKEYHLLFKDMEEVQDSLVAEKAAVRKAKETRLSDLAILRDHKVEENDYTSLSDSDLDSEIARMTEVVDMNKIADKLGDGMSRVPGGEVDDPSGIQDQQTQKRKITKEDLEKYSLEYLQLRISKGQQVADRYLANLKNGGLLPQDLKDIEGGSN